MATDHRGRELHAGKRTAQEMSSIKELPAVYGEPNRYVWSATTSRGDAGYENAFTTFHESPNMLPQSSKEKTLGSRKTMAISGTTSTPISIVGKTTSKNRAMIAAEAMKKRIEEGRDLKTGRPKADVS